MDAGAEAQPPQGARPARYRYGIVFLIALCLVVFVIVAPTSPWSQAVATGIQAAALVVVLATSRDLASVRRARALGAALVAVVLMLAIGTEALGRGAAFVASGLLAAAVAIALVIGTARLVREQGVTAAAVAGALAIYLLAGLLFAWVIAFAADVGTDPYFTGGQRPTASAIVYFSFTVLTTTGFGDYTAATRVGHALSVVEMLIGQLYLVTVIGVLIGGFTGRRIPRAPTQGEERP